MTQERNIRAVSTQAFTDAFEIVTMFKIRLKHFRNYRLEKSLNLLTNLVMPWLDQVT